MRLVLKYNEEVRMYAQPLTFQGLLGFVEKEFQIVRESADITFTDEEGDSIMIATEDDIGILQSYFVDRQYVKLNIRGVKKEKLPSQDEANTLKKEGKTKIQNEKKKKKSEKISSPEKSKKEDKVEVKEKKPKKENDKKIDAKVAEIKELLNLTVTELVDARLRTMIPCLREQLSQKAELQSPAKEQLIHEGHECSHCLISPIAGDRYECPSCEGFSLCGICERSIEHDHNLLKIKRLQEKPAKKQPNHVDKICKLILDRTEELRAKRQAELDKKAAEKAEQKERFKQANRYLSQLFGNDPNFYKEFTKTQKKATIAEIIKAYSVTQSISEDELHVRVIDLQCLRLSKKFDKQPDTYKDFVREHFDFDFEAILKCVYEQQLEKKEKKKPKSKSVKEPKEKKELAKAGNEKKEEAKVEKKEEAKVEKKEEIPAALLQKVEKVEEKQPKLPQPIKQEPKIEKQDSVPKKQEREIKRGKQETLDMMIEFYGEGRRREYIGFIMANQRYSKEDIIQMWADKFSVLNP